MTVYSLTVLVLKSNCIKFARTTVSLTLYDRGDCNISPRYSFLCPNGTLFNQQYFICDWWFNVDCSLVTEDIAE